MHTLIRLILTLSMLTIGGHLFAQPYLLNDDPDGFSPVYGSDGDGLVEDFQCPPWHTIGTILVHHDNSLVHGVQFGCSELLEDGRMDSALIQQVQLGYPTRFGNTSSTQRYLDCYPRLWTGIHGRTGARVDSLGGYCSDIGAAMSGQVTQTISAVGGNGGSFARSDCPGGQIPTGALVNLADAGHVQGIELTCSDIYTPPGLSLVGELGLLDLEANGGINPATGSPWQFGDEYRLAFVSSEPTGGFENSIGDYNAFVRRLAEDAGYFVDWRVIGSTSAINAKTNTSSDPAVHGTGVPIFGMDGRTKIADNYTDLWDGSVDSHITTNELGYRQTGQVLTGTNFYGDQSPDGRVLGGSAETPPRVTVGNTNTPLYRWLMQYNVYASSYHPVYGLSEVLTVKATTDTPAPAAPQDSDFDGIADSLETMCANNPDPQCYLRQQQHWVIMILIGWSNGGLTPAQTEQANADAAAYFATENPIYSCAQWSSRQQNIYGYSSFISNQLCSDFDYDGIADADDAFPTYASWSCAHSSHSDPDCADNYGQIEDIYLSVYGTATNPSRIGAMRSDYLEFSSGQKTCVNILQDVVNNAGVNIEPHYLACASDQSIRSAELVSMICDETGSSSIYSPERCHLGKPLYQFVSPSSFAVQANPTWYNWLGIGEVEFIAKNDFTCYTDSRFNSPSTGPRISSGSGSLCFDGDNAHEDTIFIGNEPLYGQSQTLLQKIQSSHKHTYVQWDYTYREYDTYFGRHFGTEERSQPVLVNTNFDFETPTNTEVAMEMVNQSCWRNGKNIKPFSTSSCEVHDFAVTDKTPGGDDQFTNNVITPIAEFYSQPSGFSDGGFMLNRCRVKTEYDNWLNYIETGNNRPSLYNHNYEYSCSIDNDRLDSLITSSLIAEESERIGMYMALAEVGLMAISNVVGLAAASKFATAGTKLAKAVNLATRTWNGIEASLEISSIAAQVYVLAAEDIPRCRSLTGTEREACFALAFGGTLMSLASAAGEDQLYSRSAKLMEDMSRQVPNSGQTLADGQMVSQKYVERDFRGQIEAARQLVKAETGEPDVHHQVWSAIGMDLPGLMNQLRADGQSTLATNLNAAFYDLTPKIRELDIFKRTILEISNDGEGLGTVEKSTKLLNMADGLSNIAGSLSDTDLRALDTMSPAEFALFVDLASNPGGVTWTQQTARQFLDSHKQPPATGGVCYLG